MIYKDITYTDYNGVTRTERHWFHLSKAELTDMDRLKAEMKMLEAKNIELEMENRLLKKLAEIERRWT